MDEDVHARVRRGELLAVQRTGEHRTRHHGSQLVSVDTVTDDHQLQIVTRSQHRESLHMLLRREASDEADDLLARRRPVGSQLMTARRRREAGDVDSSGQW